MLYVNKTILIKNNGGYFFHIVNGEYITYDEDYLDKYPEWFEKIEYTIWDE